MHPANVHGRSLATSTALSVYYTPEAITPLQVIEALNRAGVRFVLLGAHGLGGWMRKPRATQDVDVLVAARAHKKAVRTLLAKFPHLEADDHPAVTRLRDRESKALAVDVIKPDQDLFRAALKNTFEVESGGHRLDKLTEPGELVYPGGGKELVEKVGAVRRGEQLHL